MHAIYDLKEKLCDELEEYGSKKLDAGTLDVVDKLAHTIKNLDKIIERYEEEEYSGDDMPYDGGMSYARGGNRGGSNRGRNYSGARGRRGYSREGGMISELRELMHEAPDERTKAEFRKFIEKMEQM